VIIKTIAQDNMIITITTNTGPLVKIIIQVIIDDQTLIPHNKNIVTMNITITRIITMIGLMPLTKTTARIVRKGLVTMLIIQ
jgi:hypothetical protein